MAKFLGFLKKNKKERPYDIGQLVDYRRREQTAPSKIQIICDIDKTYLETKFETLYQMARIAFEGADDKVTVRGASDTLIAARWGANSLDAQEGFPRGLHFVSSSPPQLRQTLEEKLLLDQLDWTSDTFKNQAYNVLKGRMDQLKQHVGYKSLAIMNISKQVGPGHSFYLIGDNAESDAYIYKGLQLFLDGSLSPQGYAKYLTFTGLEPSLANEIIERSAPTLESNIAGILIRNAPGYQFVDLPPLTDGIFRFDSFFQAALHLIDRAVIPANNMLSLARKFHNQHGLTISSLDNNIKELYFNTTNQNVAEACQKCLNIFGHGSNQMGAKKEKREDSPKVILGEEDILDYALQWSKKIRG